MFKKCATLLIVFGLILSPVKSFAAANTEPAEIKDSNGQSFSNPTWLKIVNGELYFSTDGGKLYKYNTANASPTLVTDRLRSYALNMTPYNGVGYFISDTSTSNSARGRTLWKTDGTYGGTNEITIIKPNEQDEYTYEPGETFQSLDFGIVNNKFLFGDWNQYISDLLGNKSMTSALMSNTYTFAGNKIFFEAYSNATGYELWVSDGTVAGTKIVKIINPTNYSSVYIRMVNVNGIVYFWADDNVHGYELWRSDGTEAGTYMVKDIMPGGYSSVWFDDSLYNLNGTLYFAASDGVNGMELWKSDGTANGTVMVKDINVGPGHSMSTSYKPIGSVGNILYFQAKSSDSGAFGLWKSDGTANGTVLVKTINSNSSGADIFHMTEVNGKLVFIANDGVHGYEPWISDGTEAGTTLIKDFNPGSAGSGYYDPWTSAGPSRNVPDELANANGVVFFTLNTGSGTKTLWKYSFANTSDDGGIDPSMGSSTTGYSGYCAKVFNFTPINSATGVTFPTLTSQQLNRYKGKFIKDQSGNYFYVNLRTKYLELINTSNVLKYLSKVGIGVKLTTINRINLSTDTTVTSFSKRYARMVLLDLQNRCLMWYVDSTGRRSIITNPMGLIEIFATHL